MRKNYLFFLIVYFFFASLGLAQRIKYHRITLQIDPLKLENLFNSGLSIDHFSYENKKDFTAEVSDEDIALFKRNGFKVTYLIEDLEKNYAEINQTTDRKAATQTQNARVSAVTTPANFSLNSSYGGYYTFADIPVILDKMRALYPNLISVRSSIGNTAGGRPLYLVKISDNPDVDESEPELLFNALHHAREPMSLSQLVFFMWHILENYDTDKEIRTLVNSSELYILPCVNPDGYVYNQTTTPKGGGLWRKNRRLNAGNTYGVDLNRNYGYKWGYDNNGSSPTSSSDTYRGTAAFSELEISAIQTFTVQHQFVTALNFHAYGGFCTYPFDYQTENNTNPDLAIFKNIATYLTKENGFRSGNAQQTLNYRVNGGSNDWQWGEQVAKNKIFGLLPEIGSSSDGFWPASSRIIPLCNSMVEMNKKMLRISTFYGRATQNGSTIVRSTGTVVRYQFQNFSLKPATYTVTATSSSPYVTSVAGPKTYNDLSMLQSVPDSIGFTVDSNTPSGTQITFDLAVDNGLSVINETVTLTYIYECSAITGLTSTNIQQANATLAWDAVAGSSAYAVSFKPKTSSTWSSDVSVTSPTYSLTGLTATTDYDWRVKPSCTTTYSTASFTTLSPTTCFAESDGIVTFEAENYQSKTVGTGAAAGRSWSPITVSTASGSKAMTVAGTNTNVLNSLVGPRLNYALNFTTTGTYYVWVRMAAGADGIYDDSFHIGLDGGTPVTLNPNGINYTNGSQSWTWVKSAGTTVFKVVVNTPGAHMLNLWMREDGVRVDKFVMTTDANYTPTGTGPAVSGPCGGARLAAAEPTETLQVIAYPNPFDHNITVKTNASDQPTSLRMIGINGQTHQQLVMPVNETERTIQAGTLPAGAYFLEVIRGNERKVVPVRKQ